MALKIVGVTNFLIGPYWLPVHQKIDFEIATTVFKVLHHQQPLYLATNSFKIYIFKHICTIEENINSHFKIFFIQCILCVE